jgi:membrane protease YdiL (CAAX protease family)
MKSAKSLLSPKNKIILILSYGLFVLFMDKIFLGLQYLLGKVGIRLPSSATLNLIPVYLLILYILFFIVVLLIDKKPLKFVGITSFSGKGIKLMIGFVFLLMPLALLGRLLDPGFDSWYGSAVGILTIKGLVLFSLLMPFFVIKEEIIVRGIMQSKLSTYGFLWMSIALSINFAIAHFYLPEVGLRHIIIWVVSVFIGSFFLIILFDMTKNLWLSILLHLIYNIAICLQIYLHVMNPRAETIFWVICMIGAVVSFFVLRTSIWAHFASMKKKNEQKDEHHDAKDARRIGLRLSMPDIIFLVLFALVFPLLIALFPWWVWVIAVLVTSPILFL